jgi:uncharacterized small protein (DUF1192 family)
MAIEEEDLAPRRMPAKKRDLGPMSVAEMEAYIGELEEEIVRVRAEIGKREKHRAGIEGLFKKR